MNEIDDICRHLKSLAHRRHARDRRAEVQEALFSKWHGVQVVAGQVLASWGGPESVKALRSWLQRSYEQEHWWHVRKAAISALSQCVEPQDTGWILDLYFGVSGPNLKHELLFLVITLPVTTTRARLITESTSQDRDNRHAAMKAIANMPFPDRESILQRFINDPDPQIRQRAGQLLRGLTIRSSSRPPPSR